MTFTPSLDKDLLKFGLFLVGVIATVAIQSVFLSLIIFISLITWDRRFIISIVIFLPSVETIVIAIEGLTITKLLSGLLGLYMIVYLLFKKPKFDKNAGILIFFISLTLLSTSYGVLGFSSEEAKQELFRYFFTTFPKLLFALLLYLFFKKRGERFLKSNFEIALEAIPICLIIVCLYFLFWGYAETDWYNVVTRRSFEGADPNEFGGILSALSIIPMYNVLKEKGKLLKTVSLIALVLVFYSITLTLSRGAILTFTFMILLSFVIITKVSLTRFMKYSLIACFALMLFIQFGVIDVYAIGQRFTGSNVSGSLNALTADRYNIWAVGFDAFIQRPLFGHGNSVKLIHDITDNALGRSKAMHNMYFEIIVRMGLIGLITFIGIILKSKAGMWKYLKSSTKNGVFILPMLSLLVMCFSAFALSWQWRELLWYFISISLVASNFLCRRK